MAGQGTIDGQESTPFPGSSFPYQRYREHKLRETTFGATALYQFFDNQWLHPFVGAGVELAREQHFADSLPAETVRLSTTVPSLRLPAVPAIDTVTYSVRPLVTGGFKFSGRHAAPRRTPLQGDVHRRTGRDDRRPAKDPRARTGRGNSVRRDRVAVARATGIHLGG